MARGHKTGGRRKGSLNKSTEAMQQRFASQQSDDATPLDFLISAYRDPGVPIALRIHAAAKAAPFLHRALKSVEHSGEGSGPVRIEIGWEKPS
jgi:hypothetical protein